MKRPNIELRIEELVLHSFAPNDRYAIADAVQQELSRLLAERYDGGSFTSSLIDNSERTLVDGGNFRVAPGARANSIGAQIAQAVHAGLRK